MSFKEKLQEKKKTIISLGIVLLRIVMGLSGVAMLSSAAYAMEHSMILGQPMQQPAQQMMPMAQEATMGLTTEKIVVADNRSKAELEAASQEIIDSLKTDSEKKETILRRIEQLQNKLVASDDAIAAKQEEIKNLSSQLK
jgi:hypothetical protein